jgi:competence protein ComEA
VVQRVVGAVVVIGMICLGGFLHERTLRIPASPPETTADTATTLHITPPVPHARSTATPPLSFFADPLVFLSRAPADSLDLLPGIGPVIAARIVAARSSHGKFSSWDDVLAIKGIGPRMIARWQTLSALQ